MRSRQVLPILATLLCFLTLGLSPLNRAYGAENSSQEIFRYQIESFSLLLSEEENAAERTASLLMTIETQLGGLLESYQKAGIAKNTSSTSPIDRKHYEASIRHILDQCDQLTATLHEAARAGNARLEFLQSYGQMTSTLPQDSRAMLRHSAQNMRQRVSRLEKQTETHLAKMNSLLRQIKRLNGKLESPKEDTQTLYDIWIQYLLVGKMPVFSLDFWQSPALGKNWLILKQTEFESALISLHDGGIKFIFILITLAAVGLSSKRLLKLLPSPALRNKNHGRINLYFLTAVVGLSLFLAIRFTFPNGMDSLAALAAGLFLLSILKLAKHICADRYLATYGHTRLAFLFVVSTQLLILYMPSRTTTVTFMLIVLILWANDSFHAWRKKGQKLTVTAMRGGALAPLFAITLFGYGRLACLLTLLWCLGVFIRALGNVWAQCLSLETERSAKFQKGLVRSLLVPFGWAVAFVMTFLWLVDFFGEKTIATVLEMKATFGGQSLYLKDVIALAILFFLTKSCISTFKVSLEHVGNRWPRAKRGAVPSIQTLFSYAVWSLFTLAALRILGVSLTSITVIAGGLSVGIGFGLQNVVNNFISGLILLFGRSIQQGDVIEMGQVWCTVKKINIRTTLVETFENAVIMIPNSDLVTTQVTNWTKNNPTLRRDILVGVAYGSETRKVEQTLLALAQEHPHVLKTPAAQVLFNDFGASSLDFILRIWIDDIDNTVKATSELRFAIDAAFREADIEIAFPQMDIHFKTAPALAEHLMKKES
ncbi:mechanosensitive ion channel family protein [Pseudodesulfovibrio piezophilus]|uniref:MscS Mechanosensitive ion channel n=1 Tax=Pseudodesulfovibrio piezophilus (strain DSM 21447 / JCM 15486 / C1TLV30) TaxID=1322246 RepID=M1WXU9_PSEP2|nr:mechanosensitive ion channel domain-containing protein [Pseudodesulfovibrio piezophilus]CCH49938.1 MscS Mechanosensitive ion channel [Pseudodesulfovibrio piezophilus C1TLV30]